MNDTNPSFRPLSPDDIREAEIRRRVHEAHMAGQRVGWDAAISHTITLLKELKGQGRNDAAQTPSNK